MTYQTLMLRMQVWQPNYGLLNVTNELAYNFHADIIGIDVGQPT